MERTVNLRSSHPTRSSSSKRFAILVSLWLLIEGVWGLFSPTVLGVFSTNPIHATIHLILGVAGLLLATSGQARPFLWLLGTILIVVGVLFFLPGGRRITDYFAVNGPVAVLNVLLGALSLAFTKRSAESRSRRSRGGDAESYKARATGR